VYVPEKTHLRFVLKLLSFWNFSLAVFLSLESMMASEERMRLSPEETNFKRRMKTPVQLEALERVYAGAVTAHTCCLYVCRVAMYVDSTLCIFWSLCSHSLILPSGHYAIRFSRALNSVKFVVLQRIDILLSQCELSYQPS
jgi:hypothetical protein